MIITLQSTLVNTFCKVLLARENPTNSLSAKIHAGFAGLYLRTSGQYISVRANP
jgi:hypothetical protein